MQLRAEEISQLIKKQIQNFDKAALVTETGTCTARKGNAETSVLAATQVAPRVSLDAFDRAVCILNEERP